MTLGQKPAPEGVATGTRGATVRLLLASTLLSAALASGGTAALLLATAAAGTPAATGAIVGASSATAPAGTPAAPAGAAVTRLDTSDAVAAVAAAAEPWVVTIAPAEGGRTASAGGSGIVVSADGLILTTAVVAASDTTYAILLADQHETTARIVASDAPRGLVLLRAEATGLTPATIAGDGSLTVGQLVVAVGSPLGEFTDTVTAGIVSGLGRSIDLRDPSTGRRVTLDGLIQTDAAINAGSSGGPLLDVAGTVVGIVVTSAGDGQGIGFAIPIAHARALLAGVEA
ncbi:MAG TPA: trypsin-like peptidase domain-containing protein [Patescibacteria group bacterium]|nr:trypsin-like peptidase domain-containing protein [Patescibacteria group bacterium]